MTNFERKKAFSLRLEGNGWKEIGEALGYCSETVKKDLRLCILGKPRRVRSVYPALSRFIEERYGGSVRAFALDCGLGPQVLYSVLPGRRPMSPEEVQCIRELSGLSPAEILRREEGL